MLKISLLLGRELGGCFYGARAQLFAVTAHARDSLARTSCTATLLLRKERERETGLLGQARVGSTSHILGEQRKKICAVRGTH